jgi:hypothetical protein
MPRNRVDLVIAMAVYQRHEEVDRAQLARRSRVRKTAMSQVCRAPDDCLRLHLQVLCPVQGSSDDVVHGLTAAVRRVEYILGASDEFIDWQATMRLL